MAVADDPQQTGADADPSELWARFIRDRDLGSRNRLIEHYLPLCRRIAAAVYARRSGLSVEFVDYLQHATLGMIDAVARFDPARDVSFAAFASPRIRGAILNSLESLSEQYTQISLRKRIDRERLESLSTDASGEGARRPKRQTLSALADLTIGLALSRLLEGSGMVNEPEGDRSYRQEFYDGEAQRQLQATLAHLVTALPDRERLVITCHYFQGLEFAEIASLLGVTKGRVSQIHRQGLLLIREAYGGGRLDEIR